MLNNMLQSFFRKQEQESWFKEQSKFVEVLCYQCLNLKHLVSLSHFN